MISVVIPARNEERFLPRTLAALDAQTYRNFEVIVVANGCQDATAHVAREKGCRVFELGERGLGAARNLGGREAAGQILLFLDADTALEPDGLQKVAISFRRKHGCGTLWGRPDSRKVSYRLIYGLKNLIHLTHLHCGSSGAILCWKDHFEAVGGFDEHLYLRENSHLMRRLLKLGSYRFIHQTSAVTSMRRYEAQGTGEMVRLWLKVWWRSITSDIRDATYEGLEHESAEKKRESARLSGSPRRATV